MKKIKYIQKLTGLAILLFTMFACEPQIEDAINVGPAPTADQLDFTITPGDNDFQFILENTSSITGIPSWNLGNGKKSTATSPVATYSLPGDYTITMTLVTKGGVASISKTLTQTKTDYSVFTDEKFIFLSGGVDALEGKTWVLDSLSQGHLGVGPAGTVGLEWWSAAPLVKSGVKMYDDEINFKISGFAATLTNHGVSYVNHLVIDNSNYSNPKLNDSDYEVDYTPSPGTWFIENKDGKSYLTLSGPTPMFPIYDVGSNGEYEILNIEENLLELVTIGIDGNAWHYQLIPKGYVKPAVNAELSVTEASEVNTYDISLTNIDVPAGQSITGVTYNFGEGDPESTSDYMAGTSHTYMRKGVYTVTAVVNTSVGDLNLSQTITVAENHPDYVPFLLDEMVMYNDFSEVQTEPVLGQDCSVSVVENPSRIYPNKSAYCAFYSKTNNQWANAYMQLPAGYRFDLRDINTFKIMVYGKAGDVVLLKLENTDWGGNAWMSGTNDVTYTIQQDNTWEVAEYNFKGVGNNGSAGDVLTSDVTDPNAVVSHDFYNVVRIMLNPGVGEGTHEFYFDELSGPHVEGLKSARIN